MRRTLGDLLLLALSCGIAILLFVAIAWFVHGSMEMYPTDEQHEASRIVSASIGVALFTAEALVLRVLGRRFRRPE